MEVLFNTQIWNEPYIRHNPFLYITHRASDFEGDQGRKMRNEFKKIFIQAYKKYNNVLNKVVPQEVYLGRSKANYELAQEMKMKE